MTKGLELPVNIIVVIMIAMIVLIVVVVLIMTGAMPGATTLEKQGVLRSLCQTWANTGCTLEYNNVNTSTLIDGMESLQQFCADAGAIDPPSCRTLCGC